MSTRKIVIVGAGAAGVFTAYRIHELFGNQYQIILLEASNRMGGNTFSTQLDYGGNRYNIDCGAQFFFKNPQPNYNALVQHLGLEDPPRAMVYSAPAGFTVWDHATCQRRFWMPSTVDGFQCYTLEDWDRIVLFGIFLAYAVAFDGDSSQGWDVSVDQWFAKMALVPNDFKENVLKPFFYQFVSLPLARIGEASARYTITYLARNLYGAAPPTISAAGSAPLFVTYQSKIGLDGILDRVMHRSGAAPQLSTPVQCVARQGAKLAVVCSTGAIIETNDIVFACDPHTAADILTAGNCFDPDLIALLNGLEYAQLPISMQKDGACWMPDDQSYWEPINTWVDGNCVAFSAWFGPLRDPYNGNQQIPVFKSWGNPAVAGCAHEFLAHQHNVLMPTTAFVTARDQLCRWQGRDGIFFAGGWTQWFDSQEAALDSATAVAQLLPGIRLAAVPPPQSLTLSSQQTQLNLLRWLALVSRFAPATHAMQIATAITNVAING